jgi:hypothetical protein
MQPAPDGVDRQSRRGAKPCLVAVCAWYNPFDEITVRMSAMVPASFAFTRARSSAGMAIAAMIPMIATTISNSINEKPFSLLIPSSPKGYCAVAARVSARDMPRGRLDNLFIFSSLRLRSGAETPLLVGIRQSLSASSVKRCFFRR